MTRSQALAILWLTSVIWFGDSTACNSDTINTIVKYWGKTAPDNIFSKNGKLSYEIAYTRKFPLTDSKTFGCLEIKFNTIDHSGVSKMYSSDGDVKSASKFHWIEDSGKLIVELSDKRVFYFYALVKTKHTLAIYSCPEDNDAGDFMEFILVDSKFKKEAASEVKEGKKVFAAVGLKGGVDIDTCS